MEEIDLKTDYPARIATMLLEDEIDVGLVPVSIIPRMRDYHINTNYCIGSKGPVASVCIFSDNPLDQVNTVLLDYQSRTSVQLAKLLLREYWKIKPRLVEAGEDFREQIKGDTAGLVIGDRALEQRLISPYIYDLGEAWQKLTGLPFVYAAWISNKKLDDRFVRQFNQANGIGIQNINSVLEGLQYDLYDLHRYYSENISYLMDDQKMKGLREFLRLLKYEVIV
jgi:chorismate dehydratase